MLVLKYKDRRLERQGIERELVNWKGSLSVKEEVERSSD